MNKIRQILSTLKSQSAPKAIGIAVLAILIILLLWFWFRAKAKESVKEHRFMIAADSRWSPLDLHGQEQYMLGFVSGLVDFIAKDEDVRIRVIPVGTSQLYDNLDKGYYDGAFSALPPDVLKEKKYLFSEPFYLTGPVLIVPLNSKATAMSDLHTVGIERGYTTTFAISGTPMTSIVPYDNLNTGLSELVFGKIDGLIVDSLDAYAFTQGYYKDKLKVVTLPLNDEGLRLITLDQFFGKALIKMFNQGLEKAKKEKIYQNLLEKWELVDPESAYHKQNALKTS